MNTLCLAKKKENIMKIKDLLKLDPELDIAIPSLSDYSSSYTPDIIVKEKYLAFEIDTDDNVVLVENASENQKKYIVLMRT